MESLLVKLNDVISFGSKLLDALSTLTIRTQFIYVPLFSASAYIT